MKKLKKIGALVLALVMVLGMAGNVMADDPAVIGETGTITSNAIVLQIPKAITVHNPIKDVIVNGPHVTYHYVISTVNVATGTTVTSGSDQVLKVQAGPVNETV